MTIKNKMVTREAYDSLEEEARSLRKQVFDMAGATSTAYELERTGTAKLRRESGRYRDWAAGLAVLSAVQSLIIFALILF
jgi:hypothetical protein|tara:strand:+ start:950 stop:1189 length:240 start_codon:yes stop_codon:yes gene_type:complete